jgi:ribonuclease E
VSGGAVPQATFQPPPVIFQPPSPGEAADRGRAHDDSGSPDDGPDEPGRDSGEGPARKRRRRGGRTRGQDADGEVAGEDAAAGESPDGETSEPAARATAGGGRRGRSAEAKKSDGRKSDARKGDAGEPADGQADGQPGAEDAGEDVDEDGEGTGSRRRRRRRRRGSGAEAEQPGSDDPPNTVVHVRVPRPHTADEPVSASDVKSVRGSTRLEAKRQRRREGRESGRRRPPVITESEFLARRESVDRIMVVRQQEDRTQIAVLEDQVLVEHYVDKGTHQSLVGNVYLGKVQNVLPSMEAAFVDVGKGRNAVLYAGEVNFDASGLEGDSKRIESALKSGQSVLVQVTKDPVGHKGARLTSQVSLPGRYLVYVPGASMMGISRKLPDKERSRLKQILKQVMPDGAGVIVRTAAEGATEEELSRDVARLSAQWTAIEEKTKTANAPELLYSEPDLTIRVVRDIFNEDFASLVVAGDEGWDLVHEYVRYVAPHLAERLTHWSDAQDVFAHYRIDEQLAKALERKVWLPSGGSLVIDNTEAMTVVDVNTGKFTGQGGNLEETVTRNNLEAAEEIVRQLRLRDVGGIIVIDFIDMVLESNRELVLRRLLECLARDRTKHQVAEVTSLGLVQMTRKRVGSGLLEAFSEPCECCNGRGRIISLDLTEAGGSGHRGRTADEGRHAGGGRSDRSDRNGQSDRGGRQDKNGRRDRNGQADRGQPEQSGQPEQNGQDTAAERDSGTAAQVGEAEPAGSAAPAAEEPGSGKPSGRRRRRSGGDSARSGGDPGRSGGESGRSGGGQPGSGQSGSGQSGSGQSGSGQSGTAVLEQPVLDDPELGDPALSGSGLGETAPDAAVPADAAAVAEAGLAAEPAPVADVVPAPDEPGQQEPSPQEPGAPEPGAPEPGAPEADAPEAGSQEPGPHWP